MTLPQAREHDILSGGLARSEVKTLPFKDLIFLP